MKKKYILPETKVLMIQSHAILAGSITGTNVEGLSSGGYTEGYVTEGNSRRGSFWDDEE